MFTDIKKICIGSSDDVRPLKITHNVTVGGQVHFFLIKVIF